MATATRRWQLLVATTCVMLFGCGGHKSSSTTPSGGGGEDDSGGMSEANPCEDGMCPPETMDRIKEILDSKRTTMSRCLSDAVLDGKASKSAKGGVTLQFVITPSGHPRNVTVQKSTVNSEPVEACVLHKVEAMVFPEVPKDLDWSYTYAFESN